MADLKLKRGSTEVIDVLATQDGVLWDLTGYTAVMRLSIKQDQVTPDLEISGVLSGSPLNEVVFTLSSAQTTALVAHPYHYDILFNKDSIDTISSLGTATVINSAKA